MNRVLLQHVALPALAPASIVGLYFTPVMVFGCVNRGLMAIAVVLVSAVAAVITTAIGTRIRIRDRATSDAWLLSTLILLLPIALLFGPLR